MSRIQSVTTGFYRIPLPEILTDSMHGMMRDFELVTARIRDEDGAEGVGYTFTVGRNGGAIADIIEREIAEIIAGPGCRPDRGALEQDLVGRCIMAGAAARPCWRSRPSTWRCGTSRRSEPDLPLWKLLGGFDPTRCPATPAAST